ncbi:tyrosine/serine/threonine protein phosphatase [Dimargaris verticillata]|uniref:protein-tyrosine-phosphatase n=1 Tax=Dimargaris verticillata TaxID=2761393 RepID=A0A9W8EDF8_9FUNG|nr:tyrosine/serine/threonine protein phosphatase [Dimargaris verticillata]
MLVRTQPSLPQLNTYRLPAGPSSEKMTHTVSLGAAESLALRRKRNTKRLALQLDSPALAHLKHCERDQFSQSAPSTPTTLPYTPVSAETGTIGYHEPTYKFEPVAILPNLYLGDEHNAANVPVLDRLSIRSILNVAREVDNPFRNRSISLANCLETTTTSVNKRPLRSVSFNTSPTPAPGPVANEAEGSDFTGSHITYKKFPWTHSQDDLSEYFDQAFGFIDRGRESGHAVLVHCQLGVSRSASLMIAYVMRALRLTANEAYQYVKDRSPGVCPNLNLMYQLMDFEKTLGLTPQTGASEATPSMSNPQRNHTHNSGPESSSSTTSSASSSATMAVSSTPASCFHPFPTAYTIQHGYSGGIGNGSRLVSPQPTVDGSDFSLCNSSLSSSSSSPLSSQTMF